MKKEELLKRFGGPSALARETGISRQAIYKWPEELTDTVLDRLIGWAWRTGNLKKFDPPK